MFYVYVLQSVNTERFYIGVTKNLYRRLKQHNNGVSSSTKPYRPWRLIYKEVYLNKDAAYKREFYLKTPKGYLEKKKILDINRIV